MGLLQDRVALVTGSGAGIGRGIARCFAREGAQVVVAEFDEAAGRTTADELAALGGGGRFVYTNIFELETVRAAVADTIASLGRLDILVNNAYPTMSFGPSAIENIDDQRMGRAMTAGFHAVVESMRAAYPVMKAAGYGRIINLCSLNGVNAHKYTADYNSAKEAVRAYTRTAAVEWARAGITANIICPAAVTTPYRKFVEHNPAMVEAINRVNPMGYMGDPELDIGPVAVFLASDMSRYVTGNTLFADGGGHINGVPWDPGAAG